MLSAAFGIDQAAHAVGLEEGGLFVGKKDQAQCSCRMLFGEGAGNSQHRCDSRTVIIGSGTAIYGIVMSADDDNLIRVVCAGNLGLNVVTRPAFGLVLLPIDFAAGTGEVFFNKIGGSSQILILPDISFANLAGKELHMAAKFIS